ncbi:MAG: tetratricopeptide repeat protein [Pseudomonadota bacterium]
MKIASSYQYLKNYEKAEDYYLKTIELDPDMASAFRELAMDG